MYTGDLRLDLFINTLWMGWNLLLAAVPFLLAQYLFHPKKQSSLIWCVGFFLFIIFLPNAPYVLTDLVHFSRVLPELTSRKELMLWTGQFALFVLIGFILFYESFRKLEQYMLKKRYKQYKLFFRLVTFGIISIGVYFGRFLRFNSWDLLMRPKTVLIATRYLNDPPTLTFVTLYSVLLFVLYFIYEQIEVKISAN
ncbi:TPA: DUF1361 domain-containing protein [Patescibacteria group bacterium]|uniref:DUF1361 domain-containing protein n=1 Tax=Candidatus Gottesmanbacteria bacterium GW2011_GWA1_43_11 TaxID=1618436 RepID=A0A0G1ENU3_9BACT|nr:MAG: hypothetical protein UV59_C0015G0009 [Candidatus Gottesmanbacteria bacterium GW2011_GWA1_43_11]HCS78395.1 DUF1361 domain-containing protein [Patescibacteria group bacterium]